MVLTVFFSITISRRTLKIIMKTEINSMLLIIRDSVKMEQFLGTDDEMDLKHITVGSLGAYIAPMNMLKLCLVN